MGKWKSGFLVLAGLLAASPGIRAAPEAPDMVLLNGRIFTGDDAAPYVAALAIRDGRVLSTGTTAAIAALAGPHTRRIELKGHLVLPGLNDAHYHVDIQPVGTVQVETGENGPRLEPAAGSACEAAGHGRPPGGAHGGYRGCGLQ